MKTTNTVGDSAATATQDKDSAGAIHSGRKKEFGTENRFIKLVLPGSADLHWATRTPGEQRHMEPLHSISHPQKAWKRAGNGDEVEFTIAGPQNFFGWSDTGSNSIEKNINRAIDLVSTQVRTEIDTSKVSPGNIVILIKGHSRNAVAAGQIAIELKQQFSAQYKAHERPAIEVVAFDPVPGPGHSGQLLETDVLAIDNFTLVYSALTQHPMFFEPQIVKGAARLIISLQNHGAGTESWFEHVKQRYKGSNLNSLDPGVYRGTSIRIEDNTVVETLERARSMADVSKALEQAMQQSMIDCWFFLAPYRHLLKSWQEYRREIIKLVASAYKLEDDTEEKEGPEIA